MLVGLSKLQQAIRKREPKTGCESKLSHQFRLSFSVRCADAMAAPSARRVGAHTRHLRKCHLIGQVASWDA